MKILVADDSMTNLALITDSLEKLGHQVMAASHGEQAIEMFQSERPDLIILDVVMEGMSGFECAKKIRAISADDWIPIIFLSGSVDNESISQGIDAGGDDYLTKPFSEITLAAKIKAMQRIANMRNKLFEATQKLTTLSSTDTLTGVYNRLQFNKTIKEKIAQANRQNYLFALLFLDMDKFKLINDTLGHHAGDLLLIEVTKRLQSCLRVNDFLVRMGGDEFAILLSDIEDKAIIGIVSDKILNILAQPYQLEGQVVNTHASIGIAIYPSDGIEQETLLKNADIAMYEAKKSGGGVYKYFNKKYLIKNKNDKLPEPIQDLTPQIISKISVLHCVVNKTRISIDTHYIKKSLPLAHLETIPNSLPYLVGLLNLSGKGIPVIDLGVRLNIKRTQPYSLETPILLCSENTKTIGFIVDKIIGLKEITQEELQREDYTNNSSFIGAISTDAGISLLVNMPPLLAIELNEDNSILEIENE